MVASGIGSGRTEWLRVRLIFIVHSIVSVKFYTLCTYDVLKIDLFKKL